MHLTQDWGNTLLVLEVEGALKAAAEQWGHVAYDQYAPFERLAPLLPASVHAQAEQLLQAVPLGEVAQAQVVAKAPQDDQQDDVGGVL